jgi:manganese/zinc/iron transport system ATP- binding protein
VTAPTVAHLPGSGGVVPEAAIEVRDVSVQYAGAAVPALARVSLRVPAGARVALLGANGAGKSTLLKAIVGLLPLQSGTISIQGAPFASRRSQVAYLAQQSEQDWRFPISVQRLVVTGRYVHLGWLRRPGKYDHELAMAALERLGVAGLAQRQIGQLSGGQRQRVLLARALVQQAAILVLDEPFTAVDADSRMVLLDVLAELHNNGTTLLLATHDVEPDDFDDVVFLHDGRILPQDARLRELHRILAAQSSDAQKLEWTA